MLKPSNANKNDALTTIKTETKRTLSTAASVHRTCQEIFVGCSHLISLAPRVIVSEELLILYREWKNISHDVNICQSIHQPPKMKPSWDSQLTSRQKILYNGCIMMYPCQKLKQWKWKSMKLKQSNSLSLQHSTAKLQGILKVQPPFLQAPTSLRALKFREWACRPGERCKSENPSSGWVSTTCGSSPACAYII